MILSNEYREQLQDAFDPDSGGRLRFIAQKAAAVHAPVLIIGLGGTGVDSLLITKKLIHDAIDCERLADGTYSDKPRNISYLGIDTDEYSAARAYQGMRLQKRNREIRIFTEYDIRPVLEHPEQLPTYIKSWLSPKASRIAPSSVRYGTGAVRQLGRLALLANLSELEEILHNKLLRVTFDFPDCTPIYVFYLCGICGGTGGGMFLDLPYLVKAAAKEIAPGRPVRNIGLFFMPDVSICKCGGYEEQRQVLRANGFAALKELDYLMTAGAPPEEMSLLHEIAAAREERNQAQGSAAAARTEIIPEPPYDACLLLSGKDQHGRLPEGKDSWRTAIRSAAELVLHFVLCDSEAANFTGFSVEFFLMNEINNRITYRALQNYLPGQFYDGYTAVGIASARLPLDSALSYLVGETFRQYPPCGRNGHEEPGEEDVREVLKEFKLTKKGLEQSAKQKLRYAAVDGLKYSDIKSNPAQVKALYEAAKKSQEKAVRKNISEMTAALMAWIESKENLINQYFLDIQRGPVFAQQCLYSTNKQVICVLNEIRNIANAFVRDMREPEEMGVLQHNAAAALQKIVNGHAILGIGTKADRDAYIEAMYKQYDAELTNIISEQLVQYCVNAIDLLTKENNRIYEIVAELMESLVPLFEKFGAIKTDAERTRTAGGQTLSWSLVDTPAFIEQLEKRMAANPQFAADRRAVMADFYQYLFSEAEHLSDDRQNPAERINGFFSGAFGNVLGNRMNFFLESIAQVCGQTLNNYCQQIMALLMQRAEVRFPVDGRNVPAAGAKRPGYAFICVPHNARPLFAAAQAAANGALKGGAYAPILKTSGNPGTNFGDLNDIFAANFESAVSLSDYADLPKLYRAYMALRDEPGRHLYEPTAYSDADWRKLPDPCRN